MKTRIGFRRRVRRGMALLEILVVVAIMALIASAVGIAVFKQHTEAKVSLARTSARTVRAAVKTWWLTHDSAVCPTMQQLVDDGTIEGDNSQRDPWGGEWRIACEGERVGVTSNGGDHEPNTPDDIRSAG
ncbi:MAG: prepilin-type N-terminal cleavage/methylation domain-containing protein [Polyangiaceae bacterium]